ncbi:unnamed protein product [Camellia sinensis]
MVEDDQLKDTSVVAESDLQIGTSEDIGYACQDSSARLLVSPKMRAVDGGGSFKGEVQIQTSGVIKTLCGPEIMGRGINLVVDLKSTNESNGSGVGLVLDHSVVGPSKPSPLNVGLAPLDVCNLSLPSAPILQSDGVLGHLHPRHIGGLSVTSSPPNSFTPLSLQRKAASKKHRQMKSLQFGPSRFGKSTLNLRKGAVFRSAAAATSLSMARKSSRGRIDLSEAEATLELGKALGIDFEGKDEEVISKLLQLEAKDVENVRTRGSAILLLVTANSIPMGASRRSKGEIRRELFGLKRKAVAFRHQGEIEEAEEVLKMAKVLEDQLAEMEVPKKEMRAETDKHVENEFISNFAHPDHVVIEDLGTNDHIEHEKIDETVHRNNKPHVDESDSVLATVSRNDQSFVRQEILAVKRKAVALERGKIGRS